jgi:uroporphyrinogen decarboxylase
MTPRERVFAALEHREPDRIPWGEHSIDYNVYEDILGRKTLCQAKMRETRAYWEGRRDEVVESMKRDRLDLIRALEMDIVFCGPVAPKGYHPEPLEEIDPVTFRDQGGNLYRVSSTTHDLMPYKRNLDGYRPPTVEGIQEQIDRLDSQPEGDPDGTEWEFVRHCVKEMKATHFIMMTVGDLEFPRFGATEEDTWMSLVLYPDVCLKLAELRGKQMLREVRLQAKLGVDGIMPCGDLGSSSSLMASPEIYRRMVKPWHEAHVAEAHRLGLKVLKHCCGHTMPIIEDLADIYDAYEAIQATAGMDIGRIKCQVGERLTLWGGIWHEHIILGTPEDIRADARYAFANAAPGGGYIMGSTHSLAVDARPENIWEMKRCRDQWGVYPIEPARFN